MRFAEAVELYLEDLAKLRPGTARAWSSPLRRAAEPAATYGDPEPHLNATDRKRAAKRKGQQRPGLGRRDLDTIKTSDLERLVLAIREEARTRKNGIGGHGAQENATTALRALYVWARREGYTTARSDEHLNYQRSRSLERRAYTLEELRKVAQVLDGTRDPELARLFLRLALETGARHNELLELRVRDLRSASGVVRLRPKGFAGEYLEAPITAALFDALEGLIENRYPDGYSDDDPVLVYRSGRPITRRYFENLCIKVREEVPSLGKGEPDWFSTHGLRHTAGTMVQRVGGDAVARRFLGHSARGRMHFEAYSKATVEEVREALAAIWGEPLAGSGHGYGRGEAHFARLEQLRAAERVERESEDWRLRRAQDEPNFADPDPLEMEAALLKQRDDLMREEAFLRRIGVD
jgi:integrase